MMLGLSLSVVGVAVIDIPPPPEGALPADAFQEPLAVGDEGYYRTTAGGYFQEPLP